MTTVSNMRPGMEMDAANVTIAGMAQLVKCIQDIVICYAMAVPAQLNQTAMNAHQMHMTVMVNAFVSFTGQVLTVRNI